ncbi:hypothetical protein C5472_03930 [Photorhabdus sp. RW14-46]|nr:hypothetical protein [Photorhabdus sp. RW14-46]
MLQAEKLPLHLTPSVKKICLTKALGNFHNVSISPHSINNIYPMDFKMDRDGKGANPREHR